MTRIQNLKSLMNELKPAMMAFFILGITTIYLSLKYYSPSFIEGIFVEAHGMLMDIFVFAVLFAISNKLLEKRRSCLEKYQNQYKYILVDEFQDTNFAQFQLVLKLADKHRNITVVGDDAQGQRLIQEIYYTTGKAARKASKDLLNTTKLVEGEIR